MSLAAGRNGQGQLYIPSVVAEEEEEAGLGLGRVLDEAEAEAAGRHGTILRSNTLRTPSDPFGNSDGAHVHFLSCTSDDGREDNHTPAHCKLLLRKHPLALTFQRMIRSCK